MDLSVALFQIATVAKWQQEPGHQRCTNHLHNGIDGQDDLERCLRAVGADEVLGERGIHVAKGHANTCHGDEWAIME